MTYLTKSTRHDHPVNGHTATTWSYGPHHLTHVSNDNGGHHWSSHNDDHSVTVSAYVTKGDAPNVTVEWSSTGQATQYEADQYANRIRTAASAARHFTQIITSPETLTQPDTPTYEAILHDLMGRLPRQVQAVEIGRGDDLTQGQVNDLIEHGHLLDVDDHFGQWLSDATHEGATRYVEDVVESFKMDHADNPTVLEALEMYIDDHNLDLDVYDAVCDRDESNPVMDLARETYDTLVSVPAIDEDHADLIEGDGAAAALEHMGVPATPENVALMEELWANVPSHMGMAWWLFQVPVTDLIDPAEGDTFTVTGPTLIMGNPFTGGVWDMHFPDVTITANRADLHPEQENMDRIYGRYYIAAHDVTHNRTTQ